MEGSSLHPLRTVENNLLASSDLPPLKLKVSSDMEYVGHLEITLYSIAEADIFVFAEAGAGRRLRRMLIVQFEGFLDNNAHTYNYIMPEKIVIGAHEYLYDDYVAHLPGEEEDPETDGAQVMGLLLRKGYALPDDTIRRRYVRVLGDDRRREMLIIYMEDLQPFGYSAADLATDGWLLPEHSALGEALHERAKKVFTVIEG